MPLTCFNRIGTIIISSVWKKHIEGYDLDIGGFRVRRRLLPRIRQDGDGEKRTGGVLEALQAHGIRICKRASFPATHTTSY